MMSCPESSPWGRIDYSETLLPGVFLVSTPSHGGVMVAPDTSEFLSPHARRLALKHGEFLCFEEDCASAIVYRELLDKKLLRAPLLKSLIESFSVRIDSTIKEYYPEYWRSRESALQAEQKLKAHPKHEHQI